MGVFDWAFGEERNAQSNTPRKRVLSLEYRKARNAQSNTTNDSSRF